MRVKIDMGPLASFTGKLSGVPFVDGVSTRDVTPKEARKIGINVRIVDVATGEQAGVKSAIGHIPAKPLVEADAVHEKVVPLVVGTVTAEKIEGGAITSDTTKVNKYTKEQLEQIAEDDGIKGVRDVAKQFGVKGVQIAQLIEEILQAQG